MAKNQTSKFSLGRMIVTDAKRRTNLKIIDLNEKGIKATKEMKKKIYNKEKEKVKRAYAFRGFLAALGLTAAVVSGTKLIGDNNTKNPVEITTESENTNNIDKHAQFVKENQVEPITILNEKSDNEAVIDSIVASFNEQYSTDISSNDLKYIKTTNSTYLYENEDGDYLFDIPQGNDEKVPADDIHSATIYSLLDANTNNIFFSVGEITHSQNNLPSNTEYKIVDLKSARVGQKEFTNINKDNGNYLHSSEIYLDDDLKGAKNIEEKIFEACNYGYEKYVEEKNKQAKNSDELDR